MRRGALSDEQIRRRCPHFFPLDLDSSIAFHNVTFLDHKLDGVKAPRYLKSHKEIPRYPAVDMHNHAQFGTIEPERAYEEAKESYAAQIPQVKSEPATPDNRPSSVLHLGRFTRSSGTRAFDMETNNAWKGILSAKSRAFLANIGVEEGLIALFGKTTPIEGMGKVKHEEMLSRLNERFRDSERDMAILNQVERAASHHNVAPVGGDEGEVQMVTRSRSDE